jgi:hypothetical protein
LTASGTGRVRRRWLRRLAPVGGFLAAVALLAVLCAMVAERPGPRPAEAKTTAAPNAEGAETKPFEQPSGGRYNNTGDTP